jgi:hypothetical protein
MPVSESSKDAQERQGVYRAVGLAAEDVKAIPGVATTSTYRRPSG